jgi:hypothetical protein
VNVLGAIQRFATAVGFPSPTVAVASTSQDVLQVVELLNQEGRALAARHDWQALTFEANFTTVATETQGSLSTIIGATQVLKKITDDTIWDRTQQQPVWGPLSPRIWQGNKALVLTGPYPQYRIRSNAIIFYPVPTAGHSCYFEYVSKCWATDVGGATYKVNVSADTDVFLLDEDLIMAGLEWRWLRKKGLSYAEEFNSYEQLVTDAIGNERTHATLHMDGSYQERRPGTFIPSGSWPL